MKESHLFNDLYSQLSLHLMCMLVCLNYCMFALQSYSECFETGHFT